VGGVLQIVGLRIDPTYVWAGKGSDGSPVMSEPLIRPTQDGEHLAWAGPKHIDPTISSDLLRRLPLRQLRATAVRALNDEADWLAPFKIEKAGRSWPPDHYEEVARVYRNAGHAPLKAIQETWHVSRPAASKWVRKARDLGYLGDAIKHRGRVGSHE
jgi:hypothetical protein